jgi:hypothetical protein
MISALPSWLHRLRNGSGVVAAAVSLTLVQAPHVDAAASSDEAAIHQQRAQHLAFEPNRGQTDDQVRFIARGSDYTVFLTATEAVFAPRGRARGVDTAAVRMRLLDANPSPTPVTSDELARKVNYVPASGATSELTDIPTYARVRYADVYPNVDLVYRGNAGQLEYDFVVAPEGDPSTISLVFEGASSLEIDDAGALVLHTDAGDIRHVPPVVYQERDDGRERVDGRWILTGPQTVGVRIASYDRARPLVIDPLILYSSYLGGNSDDWGMDIALDTAGNVYVAGGTTSTNFPGTSPRATTSTAAFVTKLNAAGQIVYSTYILDTDDRGATGIAVDGVGNAYVTGGTSLWHPTASFDVFVAKLDAFGRVTRPGGYLYTFGGDMHDYGNRIAVNAAGNAYVVGVTSSADFPTTAGAYRRTPAGYADGFVAKINATGNGLAYSTLIGGRGDDSANDIAIDIGGNVYITGSTESGNFPVTAAGYQRDHRGCYTWDYCSKTAFVTKLNPTGTALAYSTFLGGSGFHEESVAEGIAIDSQGNAYVTGSTNASNFPTTPGVIQPQQGETLCFYMVCTDAFVTKLNPTGSALVYSTYVFGNAQDDAYGIAVDSAGNAYIAGSTVSGYFPILNAFQPYSASFRDGFVVKLNSNATRFLYSSYLGSRGTVYDPPASAVSAIAIDAQGKAYVTGGTGATDFPVTPGAAQPHAGTCSDTIYGCGDGFVTKIDASGPGAAQTTWVKMASPTARIGSSISAQWSGLADPTPYDWIGIWPLGHSDQPWEIWGGWYTTGTASGTIVLGLPADMAPGWYEVRLWSDNDIGAPVARSAPFQATH